jgi:hypothetical protein
MKRDGRALLISAAIVLTVEPALAGIGEPGLWNVADKTVTNIDPSSAISQLLKKTGQPDKLPDKTNNFQVCLSPKLGDFLWTIPKKETPLDSKIPGCTVKNRRQTDTFLAYDIECKSFQSHREVTWIDKHHAVETVNGGTGAMGITTKLTRTVTWLKADCGSVEPILK